MKFIVIFLHTWECSIKNRISKSHFWNAMDCFKERIHRFIMKKDNHPQFLNFILLTKIMHLTPKVTCFIKLWDRTVKKASIKINAVSLIIHVKMLILEYTHN